ncbi:MAG: hypothetical protein AUK35_06885 [Zetaproteobacteria bacterium CG2_30_46_52]|nr:MAG: hypothetical protein AUK35_06885 [Zetaproteobacteria bacterium CG2_30_46_52]
MNEALKTSIAEQFRNTTLGFLRVRKNLAINHFSDTEIEVFLKKIILSTPLDAVESVGKNYYFKCLQYNAVLTINKHPLTVITAKQIIKRNKLKVVCDLILLILVAI